MNEMKKATSVDEYISSAPREARTRLAELREIIRAAAPDAVEGISYNMPYYKFHGLLAGFAAYKDHVSLFGAVSEQERAQLKGFETTKGTIQFPLEKPIPSKLIRKVVGARARKNEKTAKKENAA